MKERDMGYAYILDIDDTFLSSTSPVNFWVRPGTRHLIKWCARRGTVFLNTRMPMVEKGGFWTLDCRRLLLHLNIEEPIRKWNFADINATLQKRSARTNEIDLNVHKTTGYYLLVEKGYTPVHIGKRLSDREREEAHASGTTIIEIPEWDVRSLRLGNGLSFHDKDDEGVLLPDLSFHKIASKAIEDGLTHYGLIQCGKSVGQLRTYGSSGDPGKISKDIEQFVDHYLDIKCQDGVLKSENDEGVREYDLNRSSILQDVFIVFADSKTKALDAIDPIDEKAISEVGKELGSLPVMKARGSFFWGFNQEHDEGETDAKDPFGGLPVKPPEDD